MAVILGIETATNVCSVALVQEGKVLALRESQGLNEHSALLTDYISGVMADAGFDLKQLDAIAVSIGPGSYTGLRIGVSTVKGLCYALDKPMIAVDTLKALAWKAIDQLKRETADFENLLFCPMIDARRMEVYTTLYDADLQSIEPVKALVVEPDSFDNFPQNIYFYGNGADKCKAILSHKPGFLFAKDNSASAIAVCMLALDDYVHDNFADLAYSEPFYLKDFIAGKPRLKGLYN